METTSPIRAPSVTDTTSPQTRQRTRIWSVELHVEGLIWWHTWEGYAADSMDATALAIEDFHGRWGPPPEARRLQVKACLQRGV